MNKNEKPSFLKGKGAAVATVICFVAVITMVGAFTFRNYQNRMEQELAKAETAADEETKENSEETATNEIVLPEAEGTEDAETAEEDAAGRCRTSCKRCAFVGRWQRRNSGGGSRCVVQ